MNFGEKKQETLMELWDSEIIIGNINGTLGLK
jgi:hypothetical protein